ncbi:Abortive infection bacteriophage resistance protein [Bacteroides luti]|uniref:Abortive infection bacteriophage resistance protein n=2 Tax=Bacteroides luti TaxID=1297750 RepID=A0A1M4WFE7_9BACE|nr:Abortive infection bacteriophage resistance protein [Bacteroides luti]
MIIRDEAAAFKQLQHISYYRLKGYWWDMQFDRVNHTFAPGSYFEDTIDRYNFDRQLRLILFDAIEIIEIALRTKMIYHLSQTYGGLWYKNDNLVEKKETFTKQLDELQNEFNRSGEIFAKDFRNRHPKANPDAWIIFEVATMGTLSKIYKNLKHQLPQKSIIANEMGLNFHSELSSWLESISYMRNIIAHHSRIWSRNMVKRPTSPLNPPHQWLQYSITEVQAKKPFYVITTMLYLCNAIDPNNHIKSKLLQLFNDNPTIPIYKIGFFNNWQHEPIWK